MHLLAAKPGGFSDDEGIIDLQQTAADIVILAAQDSTLSMLAQCAESLPEGYPSIRLANFVNLTKPAAFDLYAHRVLEHAQFIVVSLLGGKAYLPYGVEQLQKICRSTGAQLAIVPGDDQPDEELFAASTLPRDDLIRLWRYLREGGIRNTENAYRFIQQTYFKASINPNERLIAYEEPRPLPRTLIYCPHRHEQSFQEWQQRVAQRREQAEHAIPTAVLLFYRSHLQAGNTQAFSAFIEQLEQNGLAVLPIATASLKEPECKALVDQLSQKSDCRVFLNTTAFSIRSATTDESGEQGFIGNAHLSSQPDLLEPDSLFAVNAPVLQVILAANSEEDWQEHSQGLRSRDIAMNIALPEMDGRIISRAISFKSEIDRSDRTEYSQVGYQLQPDRAEFVAELAARWASLSIKPNAEKRIALILANYPTRDGRIGNGVGLDTPASTIEIINAMGQAGYPIEGIPETGNALIQELLGNVTNDLDSVDLRPCQQSLSIDEYQHHFATLPEACQQAVLERWGSPDQDPKHRSGRIMIAGIRLGETFVGIQPARGFNVDVAANYHDPDLVPPHSYLAFYFWLRHSYQVDAFIHIGKHGNLEWLPGKGLALSNRCWPEIALGPMPHLYPFIVNDPGEGAQAKRRSQAVVLDHLMPPMTRAETYGELQELEQWVDELYQAMGVDPRREALLRSKILDLINRTNLLAELNLKGDEVNDENAVLNELDAYLCDLKEAQIRDGLHTYGVKPSGEQRTDTLVALTRLPRGEQRVEDASILNCLVKDLSLTLECHADSPLFDPLKFDAQTSWQGPKPEILYDIEPSPWRTHADTRERLELLAKELIGCACAPIPDIKHTLTEDNGAQAHPMMSHFPCTHALFQHIKKVIAPAFDGSAPEELRQLLNGLEGGFVPPGASGAPTRGRLDVLPTGRNFYSVDSRSIPTPAAWELGQASAEQLVMRHLQEHGDYPKTLGLSVWGTATMRTGGDDIAQAFALMGIKPVWAAGSNRVTDFEIIPNFLFNRPRVDVTLRVSGFFRDAFPNVMKLYDAAVNALAEHQEPGNTNTIKQRIESDIEQLTQNGLSPEQAKQQARWRVFGSKPGAYGAGLQGLIDERCWDTPDDLAEAYINWGGYAYGQNEQGTQAFETFEHRLGQLEAVVQNQDNREHDLLDSDDYYQFQGGMTNAVRVISGETPAVYHGDHSNPAAPQIKTLQEELNRVIRSRVINPKWIAGMQRHGYKGAFEMAATVDYLFAYDATTDMISDYQYEMVADNYLFEEKNREFLENNNPKAMQEMAERMMEAIQRGLWDEPGDYANLLESLLLDIEDKLEQGM
ncbi:cobaltochelatase subunit CobN [Alkalimarinus sediminis]|uniref:Cobaltochelatase subunit CobN n=1 Tax=Alkalimarinus sediminis TaxID=1632866 RepID=A0A9E8HR70_9ALTE|nr:cobaltochelatase subunit CobN [Alkalimarinus sediminis]UZW74996.1 cobaltochelatase subunit CobN [Alkalimarinus sediminis]